MNVSIRDMSDTDLSVVSSKDNLVGSKPREWWLDIGATCHVCCDKASFPKLTPVETGEKLYKGIRQL